MRNVLVIAWGVLFCLLTVVCDLPATPTALASDQNDQLLVFYPSTIPANIRQKALKEDNALAKVDPVVFAKFREFSRALGNQKASFLVIPSGYVSAATDYVPVSQFSRAGKQGSKYRLLSLKAENTLDSTATKSVAIIDEVGRQKASDHIDAVLGGIKFSKIKRVGKAADLLPILLLGNVDYILVREDIHDTLKQEYTTPTIVVKQSVEIDYPVLCVHKDKVATAAKETPLMSEHTVNALGFSKLVPLSRGKNP